MSAAAQTMLTQNSGLAGSGAVRSTNLHKHKERIDGWPADASGHEAKRPWFFARISVNKKGMPRRRRKRGRPRTGYDPVVAVRLPAVVIGRIDRMAAELSTDRSMIVRMAMEHFVGRGSYQVQIFRSLLVSGLQGRGRGRTKADKIGSIVIEDLKAMTAAYLAARKRPKVKIRRSKAITAPHALLPLAKGP
jgi:predicted transcriptional regulator